MNSLAARLLDSLGKFLVPVLALVLVHVLEELPPPFELSSNSSVVSWNNLKSPNGVASGARVTSLCKEREIELATRLVGRPQDRLDDFILALTQLRWLLPSGEIISRSSTRANGAQGMFSMAASCLAACKTSSMYRGTGQRGLCSTNDRRRVLSTPSNAGQS